MIKDKRYVSLEEARKLFKTTEERDRENAEKLRQSIFNAHWRNAREVTTKEQLTNLLKNHERIYCLPSFQDPGNMTKKERLDIIFFIRQRLREFE